MEDKKKKLVQIVTNEDIDAKLKQMAQESERTKSQFVRWLIEREWKKHEQEQQKQTQ